MNGCVIAEAGYWADPPNTNLLDQPLGPLVVSYITNEPNYALLEATKKIMFGPYEFTTWVHDNRPRPSWGRIFEASEKYDTVVFRYSLVGRPLEGLEEFGLKLDENQIKGKRILVFFWDMDQRPSRHFIKQLAGKAEELKQKDIVVVTVQLSDARKKVVNEWMTKNKITFAVGTLREDEKERDQIWREWAIKSLPWLILTDRKHIIRAEGFSIEELEEKIRANVAAKYGDESSEPKGAKSTEQERAEMRGMISGVVVDAVTGKPIAGAYVGTGDFGDSGGSNYSRHRAQGLHAAAETDAEGRFELDGLAFTYDHDFLDGHPLVVTHPEYVRHDQTVALSKDTPGPHIRVSLTPAARIDITVVDSSSNALEDL
jgi:hypothetical protein